MAHDSTDNPDDARTRKSPRGAAADAPPESLAPPDLDPATTAGEDEDDALLPDILEESGAVGEEPLATGHEAIERAVRLAPTSPGVYRMLSANADVLYVGKAKNVKKRLSNYARQSAPLSSRMSGSRASSSSSPPVVAGSRSGGVSLAAAEGSLRARSSGLSGES